MTVMTLELESLDEICVLLAGLQVQAEFGLLPDAFRPLALRLMRELCSAEGLGEHIERELRGALLGPFSDPGLS